MTASRLVRISASLASASGKDRVYLWAIEVCKPAYSEPQKTAIFDVPGRKHPRFIAWEKRAN